MFPPDPSSFAESLHPLLRAVSAPIQPTLAVACSGGVDSMVLLHLTHVFCQTTGGKCVAIHVHHGVRETASRDAELVKKFASDLEVPYFLVKIDPESIAVAERKGQEADLRRLRYEALEKVSMDTGACALLVAHHGDDQIETVLWRLARGTSVTGVAGIRRISQRGKIPVLRPLLPWEKASLFGYATLHGVPFCMDETNESMEHVRNVVRHQVVPRLKSLNPELVQTVHQFCTLTQEEDNWLEQQADAVVKKAAVFRGNSVVVDIEQLLKAPLPLQRRAIKILLYCLASAEWSFHHIADVLGLAMGDSSSAYIELPQGLVARRLYGIMRIEPRQGWTERGNPFKSTMGIVTWNVGEVRKQTFADETGRPWQFSCENWSMDEPVELPDQFSARFPEVDSLDLRTPRPGDKIASLGMKGHRKLQDVFVDAKVPRHLRDTWPVVCYAGEVVWVPGLARSRKLLLEPADSEGWTITAIPCFSLGEAGFSRLSDILDSKNAYE